MRIHGVIETAVYVDDLGAAEAFYSGVLGLPVLAREPGRHAFFQAGEASVLLAFLPESTLQLGPLPPHGATGPGHCAFGVESSALEPWRQRLKSRGVEIEKEVVWPKGGRSLY